MSHWWLCVTGGISTYWLNGWREGDEHPPYPRGTWHLYHLLLAYAQISHIHQPDWFHDFLAASDCHILRGFFLVYQCYHFIYYSAPVGKRSIAISLSVCVSVCLSTSIFLEPLDYISSRIFCADALWPWLGPPLVALRYQGDSDVYECLAFSLWCHAETISWLYSSAFERTLMSSYRIVLYIPLA